MQHEHQQHQPQASESMDMNVFQNELMPNQEWHVPDPFDFQAGETNWGIEVPFLGHDNDFMQWLESVDWERPTG
jgi:hypothetical protein